MEGYPPRWFDHRVGPDSEMKAIYDWFFSPDREKWKQLDKIEEKLRTRMKNVKVDGLDIPQIYDPIWQWRGEIHYPPPEGNELYARALRLYRQRLDKYFSNTFTDVLIKAFSSSMPYHELTIYEARNLDKSILTRIREIYRPLFFAGVILQRLNGTEGYEGIYAWMQSKYAPLVKEMLESKGVQVREIRYQGGLHERRYVAGGELEEEPIIYEPAQLSSLREIV